MAMASSQVATKILTDNGGATTSVSFASLPTAGHGVIGYYTNAVAANPIGDPTVADNQGVANSYVKAISAVEAATGQKAAIFRCDSIGATSGTFTVTFTHAAGSSNYSLVNIQEVNQAMTLDKTASQTTTVAGVTTVTAATLSNADELVATAYTEDSSRGDSGLTLSGYTSVMLEKDSNNHISASGDYKIVAATTAPSAAYTVSTSGFTDAVAVMATFQPSGGAAAIAIPVIDRQFRQRRA
jgi:hypothetical protein